MKIFHYLLIVQVVRTMALAHTSAQNGLMGLGLSHGLLTVLQRTLPS